MRVMGLDYGEHTLGVAISDATMTLASAKETIFRDSEGKLRGSLRRIEELVAEYQISRIVLGLPLHLDGSISPRAVATEAFARRLEERLGLPVVLQDERLTTVEASERLRQNGIQKKDWKERIDSIAAEIILQDYLDQMRNNG